MLQLRDNRLAVIPVAPWTGKKTKHSVRIIVRSAYGHMVRTVWILRTVCVRTQLKEFQCPRWTRLLAMKRYWLFLPGDETNHPANRRLPQQQQQHYFVIGTEIEMKSVLCQNATSLLWKRGGGGRRFLATTTTTTTTTTLPSANHHQYRLPISSASSSSSSSIHRHYNSLSRGLVVEQSESSSPTQLPKRCCLSSDSSNSNSKLPPTPKEDQPNGTASLTFESDTTKEKDNDDETSDLVNIKKHPEESLDGDRNSYTVSVTVNMPDMDQADDNKIERWYRSPGDIVKPNDVLCDITTPTFTFGMVTDDDFDAIMGDILVPSGETVADFEPICTLLHPESSAEGDNEDEEKE